MAGEQEQVKPEGGEAPQPRMLPEDILPPELRGKPESEVRVYMQYIRDSLSRAAERAEAAERQLRELQAAREAEQPKEPDKPLEELVLEDAESAVMRVLEKRGLVNRFSTLETQTSEVLFRNAAAAFDDFSEYEADIRKILKESGVPVTSESITNTYTYLLGKKTLESRRAASQRLDNPERAAPDETPKETPKLNDLEEEARRASGMSVEEWMRYKAEFEVEVPS